MSILITQPTSLKRKFITEALFRAELEEFFKRELAAQDGFSGIEVRRAPDRFIVVIKATRTTQVVGDKGRRVRELKSVLSKRFNLDPSKIEVLLGKLTEGVAVRRACYGVLRFVMDAGARGCEIVVSGKLRGQRAKSMKFVDGLMIHSGHPVNECIKSAVRHVLLRQGMLGIKVKIMLPFDKTNKFSVEKPLPDHVTIVEPKETAPDISTEFHSLVKEELDMFAAQTQEVMGEQEDTSGDFEPSTYGEIHQMPMEFSATSIGGAPVGDIMGIPQQYMMDPRRDTQGMPPPSSHYPPGPHMGQ